MGQKKMSKSELSDLSRINLTDDSDLIINKIKKAKTDPLPMPNSTKDLDERLEAKKSLRNIFKFNKFHLGKKCRDFCR